MRLIKYLPVTLTVIVCLLLGLPSSTTAAFFERSITADVRKKVEKRLMSKEITVVPQVNKITVGFGSGNSGEFYFIKSQSKIFFQDNEVATKVLHINFESDSVTVSLRNTVLGTGKIRIYFSEAKSESRQVSAEEIEEALLFSLSYEESLKVIVNTESKTFHLHTSNHLPEKSYREEMTLDEAINDGNKPCGYCFLRPIYLPDSYIEAKLARQGAASIRYDTPLVTNEHTQNYINNFGNRVLKKWSIPLIGYKYKFQVVEDEVPNASALAGGHIMVTSGLLNSIENDMELEAVLAHEIAHVERRHVLRRYYKAVEQMMAQGMAVAMAGAAAANNQSNSSAAIGISMAAMLAIDVYYAGYPKNLEREADDLAILYFQHNGMDKKYLKMIFRKFEFQNLVSAYNPDPQSDSHPFLEERIKRVNEASFRVFEDSNFIYSSANSPTVQLDFLYQVMNKDVSSFYIYISDYPFLSRLKAQDSGGKGFDMYLQIKDKNGKKNYYIVSNKIVKDMWGAYLTFKDKKGRIIEDIEQASIIVKKEGEDVWETRTFTFEKGVTTY